MSTNEYVCMHLGETQWLGSHFTKIVFCLLSFQGAQCGRGTKIAYMLSLVELRAHKVLSGPCYGVPIMVVETPDFDIYVFH